MNPAPDKYLSKCCCWRRKRPKVCGGKQTEKAEVLARRDHRGKERGSHCGAGLGSIGLICGLTALPSSPCLHHPTGGGHKRRKQPFMLYRQNQRLWEPLEGGENASEPLIGRDRRTLLCGFHLFNICVWRTEAAKPGNKPEASEQREQPAEVTARAERRIVSAETKSLFVSLWQSVRRRTKGQFPANQFLRRQPPSSQGDNKSISFHSFTSSNAGSHFGVKCRIFLLRCSNKSGFGVMQKAAIDKTTIAGRLFIRRAGLH